MQKYILSALALFSLSQNIYAKFNTEIIVDWNCPSINYEKPVLKFPDKAQLIAELQLDGEGGFKIKLKDNFLQSSLDEKVSNFVTGIFKDKNSTHSLDYKQCIDDFKSSFKETLENKYYSICYGLKCPNSAQVINEFNSQVNSQPLVIDSKILPKVPFYFTGHDTEIPDTNLELSLINYCTKNKDIPIEIVTHKKFIELVAKEVSNLNKKVTDSCLDKITTTLKKYNQLIKCNPASNYPCEQIINSADKYADHKLDFQKNYSSFLSWEDKKTYLNNLNKEEMILNSSGYRLDISAQDYSLVKSALKEIITKYKSSNNSSHCNVYQNIKKGYSNKSIYAFDEAISENLDYIKENFSDVCLKSFIEHYMSYKFEHKDPEENILCKTHNCNLIKQNKILFTSNYLDLVDAQFGIKGSTYLCQAIPKYESKESHIVELLNNINNVNQCSELNIGETKVVNDYSTTGVTMRYALKREGSKKLLANIVIDFKDGQEGTTLKSSDMLKQAQNCLEQTSSYFRSPTDEAITVKILSPSDASQLPNGERPLINDVSIGKANMRSNSSEYAQNIDCPTITHEVLHLMGLCDEYEETVRGYFVDTTTGKIIYDPTDDQKNSSQNEFQFAYNQCRPISKVTSIMSDHWDAVKENTARKSVCKCESNTHCESFISLNDKTINDFLVKDPFRLKNTYNSICTHSLVSQKNIYSIDALKSESLIHFETRASNKITYTANIFEMSSTKSSIKGKLSKYRFNCQCNHSSCMSKMKELFERPNRDFYSSNGTCTYPIMRAVSPELAFNLANKNEIPYLGNGGINILPNHQFEIIGTALNSNGSLLHPAHFARIKYGSCKEKVQKYSTCAKFAYKKVKSECPERPTYCKEDESWLLTDQ